MKLPCIASSMISIRARRGSSMPSCPSRRVAELGIYNGLAHLIKDGPGIPDFYQGTELWI
jgi:maltooligosyltrehalose synthase